MRRVTNIRRIYQCTLLLMCVKNVKDNALVNFTGAQPAPLPPGWPPGISIFFALDGKFPEVGTKKEGKCPLLRQHWNIFHWSHSQIV